MTISGIITMVASIGTVWALFTVCVLLLVRKDRGGQ